MPRKPKPLARDGEQTQTTPGGLEIPVPSRGEFFKGLERAARTEKEREPISPEAPSRSES
jgi:hypothetical protein